MYEVICMVNDVGVLRFIFIIRFFILIELGLCLFIFYEGEVVKDVKDGVSYIYRLMVWEGIYV